MSEKYTEKELFAWQTLERKIIHALLSDEDALAKTLGAGLSEEHFKSEDRKTLFRQIVKTKASDLKAILISNGTLQREYFDCIDDKYFTTCNIIYDVKQLISKCWMENKLFEINNIFRLYLNKFELVDQFKNELIKLAENCSSINAIEKKSKEYRELALGLTNTIEDRIAGFSQGKPRGYSTGLKKLDDFIQGFYPGRLYILGARTSVGKTTLAVNFANSISSQKKSVAFFTVEMSPENIAEKHVSLLSRVDSKKIFSGNLSEEETERVCCGLRTFSSYNGVINNRFGRSIQQIETECRYLHRQGLADVVIIDYIGQLQVDGKRFTNRQAEISEITARLQELAISLNVPILALAQINRMAACGEPQLHHLKDSGSIEQDADVVFLLHRDESDEEKPIWFMIPKNRHGGVGKFKIGANMAESRFYDLEK